MNTKKLVLYVTAIMIGSFAIAFIIMASTGGGGMWLFSSGQNGHSQTIDHSISYDAVDYSTININTASVDVELIPTEADEIEFHFYGEASVSNEDYLPKLVVNPAGQNLTAKIEYPTIINIGLGFGRSKLDVYIPEGFIEEISVTTASGDIDITDLELERLKVDSASGQLNIGGIQTESAGMKTLSGDINIENFIGELQASSMSGKIQSQVDSLDGDINIKSTSGKIELYLPESADFDIIAKSVSGKMSHNFLVTMENSIASKRIEAEVGSGEYDIELETVSGNILMNQD